jgi:bla regulator protein blaR1
MSGLCFAYFFGFGTALGIAASLGEASGRTFVAPRWLWLVAITSSVSVPIAFWIGHSSDGWMLFGYVVMQPTSTLVTKTSGVFSWRYCNLSPLGMTIMKVSAWASAALAVWAIGSSVVIRRTLRRADHSPDATAQLGPVARDVVLSESLGPATIGIFGPRIVIPRWALGLSPRQLAFIVRHEEEHCRARDTALLLVAGILITLMPWNVPLWWQLRRLRLAIETDCDRRVVSALGDPVAYSSLLVRIAEAQHGRSFLQPALLGRPGMLERRLSALCAGEPRDRAFRVAALSIAALIAAIAFAVPHPMAGPGIQHRSHTPAASVADGR